MTHALTPALPAPPATPGFATMVTAAPIAEVRSAAASTARWAVGVFEILFVGVLVPIAILVVGAPIALVVRAVIGLLGGL